MKFFSKAKDGGPQSPVTGYFFVEIKSLFSIVLLHFNPGTREAFHSHAFNAVTLWLRGVVLEQVPSGKWAPWYAGNFKYTPRILMHRIVASSSGAWAISFRGPWAKTWQEFFPRTNSVATLANGRRITAFNPALGAPYGDELAKWENRQPRTITTSHGYRVPDPAGN